MAPIIKLIATSAAVAWSVGLPLTAADHAESLLLRPLPVVGKVLAHFHFATDENDQSMPQSSYPRAIQQILTKYDAESLFLSFAVGSYDQDQYGEPRTRGEKLGHFHAPFGTRLQVLLRGNASRGNALERWKGVTSELGGIFSASLNQMDETTVIELQGASSATEYGGYGGVDGPSSLPSQSRFMQATLAREELCTENLTPWLKVLPCRAHAGLGTLLDPIKLLSGEYLMVSIYARHNEASGSWVVDQHLTTVQTVGGRGNIDWSLASLFHESRGRNQELHACPIAASSTIRTELVNANDKVFLGTKTPVPLVSVVDLKAPAAEMSTSARWMELASPSHPIRGLTSPRTTPRIHRFLSGYGQVRGGIAARIENRHPTCAVRVRYHDFAPWYIRLYFHTFQSRTLALQRDSGQPSHVVLANSTSLFRFTPAELRGRPNEYHVEKVIPPASALLTSVQFERAFVRLSEHPPDANRGFDIPAGVATVEYLGSCRDEDGVAHVLFTEPLLVALPTPDFSMPYNVIMLTSTVVAFCVASMLNTLLRKPPRIQRILATKEHQDP